jgi:flavin reductase (DIM6/NTAB) family NADH-FMN oxidoreductase RutF
MSGHVVHGPAYTLQPGRTLPMTCCPATSTELGVLAGEWSDGSAVRRSKHQPAQQSQAQTEPDGIEPDGIGPELYRAVFQRFANGVAVVTADAGGGPVGFTATSLTSVSLDPPLVSFTVSATGASWPVIAAADTVVINILNADQEAVARHFATRGVDRFADPTRWSRLPSGEPILDDAPSRLLGLIEHRYPAGDHRLVVARVVDAHAARDLAPLVYHAGRYQTVSGD